MTKRLLPLTLRVKTKNWRMFDTASQEADSEFVRVRKDALERDDHTCQFCGFRCTKWQEVHHQNDDHHDNRKDNLVTACPMCHSCQHIGLAGRNKTAKLIWLPEVSQAELHHIVRACWVAKKLFERGSADATMAKSKLRQRREFAELAGTVMSSLSQRTDEIKQRWGTDDPQDLANALLQLPEKVHDLVVQEFGGMRLLPMNERDPGDATSKQIEYWIGTTGPYVALLTETWEQNLRTLTSLPAAN